MSCTETRPLLAHRPLDALEDDELGSVDAHLAECDACAAYLASLDAAYVELEGEPIAPELPAGLWSGIAQRLDAGEGDQAEPKDAAETSRALTIALVCTYCHDALTRPESRYCAGCLAPHHADCFRAHGTCAAPGCEETHVVRPTLALREGARPRRRRSGRAVWITAALSAVLAGAGVVAAWRARVVESGAMAVARQAVSESDRAKAKAEKERQQEIRAARQLGLQAGRDSMKRELQLAEGEAAHLAKTLASEIPHRRIYLGVRVSPIRLDPAASSSERGLRVDQVLAGSLGERHGLRRNDVLLKVDHKVVSSGGGLARALQSAGEKFSIAVRRDGVQHLLIFTVPLTVVNDPPRGSVYGVVKGTSPRGLRLHVSTSNDVLGKRFVVWVVHAERDSMMAATERVGIVKCVARLSDPAPGWDLPDQWSYEFEPDTPGVELPVDVDLWLAGPLKPVDRR